MLYMNIDLFSLDLLVSALDTRLEYKSLWRIFSWFTVNLVTKVSFIRR